MPIIKHFLILGIPEMDGLAMTETLLPALMTQDENIERASRSLKAMSHP